MKEFNQNLKNSFAKIRSFPGASPFLVDETVNPVIIHGVCNDRKQSSNRTEFYKACNGFGKNGVNEVFILSRRNTFLNER